MEQILIKTWETTIKQFKNDQTQLSSEKSLVFNYAYNLKLAYPEIIEVVDFERSVYRDLQSGTFIDLYITANIGNQKKKIGIEFKYPHNKGGNTNQTQTRQKCINDIKRLSHLVANNDIDLGVFLMATKESPYLNKGKYTLEPNFETYNGKNYKKNDCFPCSQLSQDKVTVISDLQFIWHNYEMKDSAARIASNQIAWLEPIIIKKE